MKVHRALLDSDWQTRLLLLALHRSVVRASNWAEVALKMLHARVFTGAALQFRVRLESFIAMGSMEMTLLWRE